MNDGLYFESEYQDEPSDAAEVICLTVDKESVGKRIDAFIAENSALTRSAASRLIENGDVSLTGAEEKILAKNYKLREGDGLTVRMPLPEPCEAQPEIYR